MLAIKGTEWLLLCERIADLCGPAGERDTANAYYQKVLKVFRSAGHPEASARILRKLGRLLWDSGKRDEAEIRYTEAATLLEGIDSPVERAHLLQERGHLAFRIGRPCWCREVGRPSIALRKVTGV